MEIDLTITLSIIIISVTAISPIIVAIINNCHQYNVKKLEVFELQKREALENFISTSIDAFNQDSWKYNKEFMKSLYTLQLYFKNANSKLIKEINELIASNKDIDKFKLTFVKVVTTLSKEIQKH